MDFNEQTYQRIQRYLDAEMDAAEAAAFEAEVNANPELAREVQLNVEMEQLLAETEENELRKNLQHLNTQFADPKDDDKGIGYWRFLLLIIPFLLGGIWWWNTSESIDNPFIEPHNEVEDLDENDPLLIVATEIDTSKVATILATDTTVQNATTVTDTDSLNTPELEPPPVELKFKASPAENLRIEPFIPPIDTTAQRDSSQIYVSDPTNRVEPAEYSSIPSPSQIRRFLESLRQNNENQTKIQLTNVVLEDITINVTTAEHADSTVTLQFSGQINASSTFTDTTLAYHIDNEYSYLANSPLYAGTLALKEIAPNTYIFNLEREIASSISTGTYYILLTQIDTREVLWVEQFYVNHFAVAGFDNYLYDWSFITEASTDPTIFPNSRLQMPTQLTRSTVDSNFVLPLEGQITLKPSEFNRYASYQIFRTAATLENEYEASEPLLTGQLPLIPVGDFRYLFIARDRITLPTGEYYLILKSGHGYIQGVRKFRVAD